MPIVMLMIIKTISPVKMLRFLLYNAYTRVAQGTRIISLKFRRVYWEGSLATRNCKTNPRKPIY